ncbi:MAG: hypothetical protein ABI402_17075 [Ferruginibacter sp.]
MKNKIGIKRFEFYLVKLEVLLLKSSEDKNPALWLYTNGARTPLFMLESLAKLYSYLHNRKRFEKIKLQFKFLEDTLGAIDYYDGFAKEFVNNPAIPTGVTEYLHAQTREKIQRLNDLLIENKWIGDRANRIEKIRKKLYDTDWLEPKEELKAIFNFYKTSISNIKEFITAAGDNFTEIESQVHTLRRKLRWLSIYPQSLQGIVQLNTSGVTRDTLLKYLTPEIVNSPFNKMPEAGDNSYFLLLEKNYFLALSWMIAELGKLKDNGLRVLVITEALQQTEGLSRLDALNKAYDILGGDKDALQKILANANAIIKTYLEEKNLDKLIYGVTSSKKV